jgi:hypothetical protein
MSVKSVPLRAFSNRQWHLAEVFVNINGDPSDSAHWHIAMLSGGGIHAINKASFRHNWNAQEYFGKTAPSAGLLG